MPLRQCLSRWAASLAYSSCTTTTTRASLDMKLHKVCTCQPIGKHWQTNKQIQFFSLTYNQMQSFSLGCKRKERGSRAWSVALAIDGVACLCSNASRAGPSRDLGCLLPLPLQGFSQMKNNVIYETIVSAENHARKDTKMKLLLPRLMPCNVPDRYVVGRRFLIVAQKRIRARVSCWTTCIGSLH